jgi:hypothetical protein
VVKIDATGIIWLVLLLFIITVFPLYIIVKLLGGRITMINALIIKVVCALLIFLVSLLFGAIGPLLVALLLIGVYMFAFRIGIIRAFLAWILEGVVLAGLLFALNSLGIATIKWSGLVYAFQHLTSLL